MNKKNYAKLTGKMVANNLFQKFLAPENRGEDFTWENIVSYVADMAATQVSISLPISTCERQY
jgi:hypothetical protein